MCVCVRYRGLWYWSPSGQAVSFNKSTDRAVWKVF